MLPCQRKSTIVFKKINQKSIKGADLKVALEIMFHIYQTDMITSQIPDSLMQMSVDSACNSVT